MKRGFDYRPRCRADCLCVFVFAQGFGEYGRPVGSIPHGQGITTGRPSGERVTHEASLAAPWSTWRSPKQHVTGAAPLVAHDDSR